MSPEDIARRHEEMLGYELVDYAEVALPIWQLSVEAISIAHRRFTPIQEYALRGIAAELLQDELSGFLGLEKAIIEGVTAQLVKDRLIEIRIGDTGSGCSLTKEGAKALQEEGLSVPVEDQFQIFYDGIHRVPTMIAPEQIALPRDTEAGILVELPAIPPNRPAVSDLKLADIQRVLEQQSGGRSEFGRDVISIKRIARYRRLFRRGVGLVFKGTRGGADLRMKLIIGGVRAEDIEHRFAEQGGLSRPGFMRAFSDAYLNANLRKHLGTEVAGAMLDGVESQSRQRTYSVAKLRMSAIQRKISLVEAGELPNAEAPSREQVEKYRQELVEAKAALDQPGVRSAAAYEQCEFLRAAFSSVKHSISLSSLGLSGTVVTGKWLEALEICLKRGVSVSILVDRQIRERDSVHAEFGKPYTSMQRLANQHPSLKLNTHNENRYFHLAIDNTAMLVSNRPFLSNTGRIRTFEQYSGYFVRNPELIRAYLDRVRPTK